MKGREKNGHTHARPISDSVPFFVANGGLKRQECGGRTRETSTSRTNAAKVNWTYISVERYLQLRRRVCWPHAAESSVTPLQIALLSVGRLPTRRSLKSPFLMCYEFSFRIPFFLSFPHSNQPLIKVHWWYAVPEHAAEKWPRERKARCRGTMCVRYECR